MMDPIMQSLFDRKSVRVFTGEPVTAEEKALLLEAAHQAPTGGNQQSYAIIDITDQAIKDQLSELCDHQPFIATADVVLIFCGDSQRNLDTYREAGMEPRLPSLSSALGSAVGAAIVAQNVVVAAQAMGLGSCYIGDIMENCEKVRELLDIPEYVIPGAMLVIGRPTQQQKDRPKPERFEGKYLVHENRYRRLSGEELRDMYRKKAGAKGFDAWVKALCERKYESDFAKEMARSVKVWLKPFMDGE